MSRPIIYFAGPLLAITTYGAGWAIGSIGATDQVMSHITDCVLVDQIVHAGVAECTVTAGLSPRERSALLRSMRRP